MDNFMNLDKQGYAAYKDSQDSSVGKTGGAEYNSPHHSGQGRSSSPDLDHDEVVRNASQHGSGDSSLFTSALGFLGQNKSQHGESIDEEDVQRSHKKAYQDDSAGSLDASSMGAAAALQALKKFTSGSSQPEAKSSGGSSQLISLAMAEATKLFDKSGGASQGNKQDAVNSAAMTVMKLLVQSKFSGTTGGGNSGGLSSLMSLATKFA
ncbi:hypothetical protein OF83DRAFT_740768 [Amylostereum chailletii]|nr:hypothetical protein OF83DRAFT_740768 [Amylostereum chailletii]